MASINLGLASLTVSGSLTITGTTLSLVNDNAAPGNNYYYGTNGSGTKGFFLVSAASASSITGTANQVLVNGTSGSAQTGAVTLTLATALVSINSVTASSATDLTLSGGSSGASAVIGQGTNGDITLTPSGTGSIVQGVATDVNRTLYKANINALDSNSGDWRMTYENSANGFGSRPNRIFALGYNYAPGGTPVKAGEPAMAWIIETYFNPLGTAYVEGHLQYTPTGGAGLIRPLSTQIVIGANVAASTTSTTVVGDSVQIADTANTARFTVSASGVFVQNGLSLYQENNNVAAILGKKAGGTYGELLKVDASDVLQIGAGTTSANFITLVSSATSFNSGTFTSSSGAVTLKTPSDNSQINLFSGAGSGQVNINGLADIRMNQGGNQCTIRMASGGTAVQIGNVGGANPALFRFGPGGATGSAAYYEANTSNQHIWAGASGTEVARLVTNLLIGGTSDISGSGGLKVFGTTAATNTTSGALQVAGGVGITGTVWALNMAVTSSTLTYAATVNLDFTSASGLQTVTLTGNITFGASSNLAAGRNKVVRIVGDSSSRALAFPAGWKFVGGAAPTALAANKVAILSTTAFGSADTDVVAAYSVEP